MVYGMLYLVYGSISMNIVYQIGFWHTVYYIVYSIYHTFKYYQTLRGIWNAIWYVVHVYTVYIYIHTHVFLISGFYSTLGELADIWVMQGLLCIEPHLN